MSRRRDANRRQNRQQVGFRASTADAPGQALAGDAPEGGEQAWYWQEPPPGVDEIVMSALEGQALGLSMVAAKAIESLSPLQAKYAVAGLVALIVQDAVGDDRGQAAARQVRAHVAGVGRAA